MLVCLDPGHAAKTSGKRSPDASFFEYKFNRDVAKRVKKLLNEKNVEVVYSVNLEEEKDKNTYQRADIANNANADLYVSIHANASGNGSKWELGRGIETYIYAFGGKTENIGRVIHRNVIKETGLKDRGLKTYGYDVLLRTKMPALLLELGFYDNKEELKILKTDEYKEACSRGIAKGIFEYYEIGKDEMNEIDAAKDLLKKAAALSDETIKWLSTYKYSDDLFIKISRALKVRVSR